MRVITLLAAALLFGCTQPTSRGVSNPFPQATEVRLFVESGEYDPEGRPILASSEGRKLTDDQRKAFEATLRVEPMPDEMAACFVPHHFFGYFDAQGSKVGELAVCFCCAGVSADPDGRTAVGPNEILSADYVALEKFVRSMGEPTDIEC